MRTILLAISAGGLLLAGCSESTETTAEQTVDSAATDTAANTEFVVDETSEAISEAEARLDHGATQRDGGSDTDPVGAGGLDN
ncbi:hypothetical protein [Altericroceibacterium xinjiangense]|uniref:hypothetical protein n=1 Tax=Altericroceibacterium xinjiangense TaxID=762261 RepID=UPI000F7E9CBC|nr:hypothetical protein [Altericroceibacterium xinjiangense]